MSSQNNCFNLIRIAAAIQVFIIHLATYYKFDNYLISFVKLFPGVPVFFFISGYLVTKSYYNIIEKKKSLINFFWNRFLRIYPGLIVCFFISLGIVYLSGFFEKNTIRTSDFILWTFANLSIFQFYNPEFFRTFGTGVLNGPLWSISVEIQFYFLLPIILILFKGITSYIFLITLFMIFNIFHIYFLGWDNIFEKLYIVSFFPWFYMFLLGSCFYKFKNIAEFLGKFKITYLFIIYLIIHIFFLNLDSIFNINLTLNPWYYTSLNPLVFLVLSMLVFKVANLKNYFFNNFFSNQDYSYGIYIYHMPVINFFIYLNFAGSILNIFIIIFTTLLLSFLSFNIIEKRFLKFKKTTIKY